MSVERLFPARRVAEARNGEMSAVAVSVPVEFGAVPETISVTLASRREREPDQCRTRGCSSRPRSRSWRASLVTTRNRNLETVVGPRFVAVTVYVLGDPRRSVSYPSVIATPRSAAGRRDRPPADAAVVREPRLPPARARIDRRGERDRPRRAREHSRPNREDDRLSAGGAASARRGRCAVVPAGARRDSDQLQAARERVDEPERRRGAAGRSASGSTPVR